MTFAAAALTVVLRANPDPLVTLDQLPVMRLDRVLENVSKQTGVRLAGMGSANGQFVFVQVKDLPLSKLKEHLAVAVEGKWARRGNMDVISSSLGDSGFTDYELRRRVENWFKKVTPPKPLTVADADSLIKKAKELNDKMQSGDHRIYEQIQKLNEQAPFHSAMVRVALALGPDAFSSLKEGQRVVYSTSPTRLQQALPPQARQALAQMNREVPIYADRVKALAGDGMEGGYYAEAIHSYLYNQSDAAATILVSIARQSENITLSFHRFGKAGETLGTTSTMITGFGPDDMDEDMKPPEKPPFAELTDPVKLTDADRKIVDEIHQSMGYSMQRTGALSPEAVAALSSLDKRDLLDYYPSAALRQAAGTLKRNIVAFVPDFLGLSARMDDPRSKEPAKLSAFMTMIAGTFGTRLKPSHVDDGTTITFAPPVHPMMRTFLIPRFNRPALQSSVARAVREGMSLDVAADMTQLSDQQMLAGALTPLVSAAAGEQTTGQWESANNPALKIYGNLNEAQRRQAKTGVLKLPLNSLGGSLRTAVEEMMFYSGTPITPPPSSAQGAGKAPGEVMEAALEDEDEGNMSWRYNRMPSSLAEEPTVALAGGLPPTAFMEISVSGGDAIYGFMSPKSGQPNYFMGLQKVTARNLAWAKVMAEKNPQEQSWGNWDEFSIGGAQTLKVRVLLGGIGSMERGYVHDRVPKGSKRLALNDLPADFRKRYEEEIVKAREQYKDVDFSGGRARGGAKPPR